MESAASSEVKDQKKENNNNTEEEQKTSEEKEGERKEEEKDKIEEEAEKRKYKEKMNSRTEEEERKEEEEDKSGEEKEERKKKEKGNIRTEEEERKEEEKDTSREEEEEEDDSTEEEDNTSEEERMVLDLKVIRDGFTAGVSGEVPLDSYLQAYGEMNKFFTILGPLFHFVAYDVKRKVEFLRGKVEGEDREHFVDVRTMLDFENNAGLLHLRPSPETGSKVLLQLHRALEFTVDFMKESLKEEEEPPLGQVASALYKATMGRFHPPILATPIAAVILLLPLRATIRSRMTRGRPENEEVFKKIFPEVIEAVRGTYEACQMLYAERDLLLIE